MKYASAYIEVPFVLWVLGIGGHFAEVESDNAPAALHQRFQQENRLLKIEPTGDRGARMRTEFGFTSIDVEGYVNRGWQRFYDVLADRCPGLPLEKR